MFRTSTGFWIRSVNRCGKCFQPWEMASECDVLWCHDFVEKRLGHKYTHGGKRAKLRTYPSIGPVEFHRREQRGRIEAVASATARDSANSEVKRITPLTDLGRKEEARRAHNRWADDYKEAARKALREQREQRAKVQAARVAANKPRQGELNI